MKKTFLLLCLAIWSFTAIAQNAVYPWAIEVRGGVNQYYGEYLKQYFNFKRNPHAYFGVGVNRYLTQSFDLSFQASEGRYAGATEDYTYRFRGQLTDVFAMAKYKLNNGHLLSENSFFAPYLIAGVGASIFSDYSTYLTPLPGGGTPKSGTNLTIPMGVGFKVNLTKRIAAQYQFLFNLNFSDIRDGHLDGRYDNHMKQSIGLVWSFGKKKDKDNDGVPDKEDYCPGTPKGLLVDPRGCPEDNDKDGVPDYKDKCPNTASGIQVDSLGCPADTDGDGVPNSIDKCPDQAGLPINNGCPDSDNDGVADFKDKCPNTPVKIKVDSLGCPVDSDGDGVTDDIDQCPNIKGLAIYKGCPDTDGDSIPDNLDRCPAAKGTKANKGCPEMSQAKRAMFKKAMKGIEFETGKDVIRPVSYPLLDNMTTMLKVDSVYTVTITGYTDNTGSPEKNKELSQKRADAVKQYFVEKGVKESRITAIGKGDENPIADNNTKKGRDANRRVEFLVEVK